MIDLGPDLPRVRRAAVFGLARSGRAATAALAERGVSVVATDARPETEIAPLPPDPLIRCVLGGHPAGVLDGVDLVVVSPGVPLDIPVLRTAAGRVPVIAEIELAARLLGGPVIGITGTNGKSTTTSLCAALLQAAGRAAIACGNLGTAWVEYATAARAPEAAARPVWVVELSSFQLEATTAFAPDVAVHLNLTPDHLDRHGSLEAYAAAKARIFLHQRADQLAVLNGDDPAVRALAVTAARAEFSRTRVPARGTWLEDGRICSNMDGRRTELAARADLALAGAHNEENALAALAAAVPFGVTPAHAISALRAFSPLPHRMRLVRMVRGVAYYNDSKGTNIDATLKSLEGMEDRRVHLILGGKKKNDDFGRLRPLVRRKAKAVLAIGAAQQEICERLGDGIPVTRAGTIQAAIAHAHRTAEQGDVVLLSPACASFDQFRSFEHRGEVFEQLVRELADERTEAFAQRGCERIVAASSTPAAAGQGPAVQSVTGSDFLTSSGTARMNVLESKSIHFVGIGGAGMSPLAELLAREGRAVSGSDLLESETTRHLRSVGAKVFIGHDAKNLGRPDAVVHTAAVRPDNPELVAARSAGIPLVRRADLLGELMRRKLGVAISGAHGKTTTTAMIGAIAAAAGRDPAVIVGGSFRGGGSNLRPGRGEILVAEADEYDRAFHSLAPVIAVITNIDLEHLDTYRSLDDLKDAFVRFADSVPDDGVVIAGIESPPVSEIAWRIGRRCVTFAIDAPADVGARGVAVTPGGTRFELVIRGRSAGAVALRVPGAHNVRNALAAIAAARELGIPPETASAALAGFAGMARRFEVKGETGGVLVIDDYAHHPTEIAATLEAARRLHPARRIVAVFQPHLYSRTRDLAPDFGRALLEADVALIAPIYPAREQPIPGVTSELIADAARRSGHSYARGFRQDADVEKAIRDLVLPGDLLLTLGAGDVARFGQR